ncbi:MAG: lipase family protein [Candidatus Marinimicrobia bacterium]|nr:lipase family protein [Candidatus Neomarinimicrobiota bacterium]
MSRILKIRFIFILGLIIQLSLVTCEKDNQEPVIDDCNPAGVAGELLSSSFVGTFTPAQVQTFAGALGVPVSMELTYTVDAYTMTYETRDKNDALTIASGVIFVPRGIDTLDLLSVQHGTIIKRSEVGSQLPYYAADGLISAMNGYLVASPDYLGLGVSDLLHPYLHAELSANAVIDMIRATRIHACQSELLLSDRLFLAGYSEGGYVTLATQQAIEMDYADEFQLTAVAPMAGPYDLLGSTETMLKRKTYDNPSYLAYLVTAYNDIYEWDRLAEIFEEPFASRIPRLFNGNYSGSDIHDSLTTEIDSLFQEQFRVSFLTGNETQIEAALIENSPLNWGPIAPVRLYHGTSDSTVYFENSQTAFESMQKNGGLDVGLVPLNGANHETGAFPSYYLALTWFESLRNTP